MIVIDMDMPKNCVKCELSKISVCPIFYRNAAESSKGRLSDCPIKCDVADIKSEIHNSKLWKGFSKYPNVRKHDVGLDRYYDMGLDKAFNIIDTNINSGDADDSN